MAIKLGVLDLVPVLEASDSAAALEQAVRLARTAEELGYSRYWAAEHHDLPGLACPAPEVLLAYIGAQTERIRLGSGALLLPHYKPIKVAETFRLLASLCPGRMDLGIGRAPGGSAHVSLALSDNFLDNVRRLPESIQALSALLTDQYELEGHPVTARPIPPCPPELWMLGTNDRSASYAAQFGTGYVFGQFMSERDGVEVLSAYRKQFQPSALAQAPQAVVAINILCAETEEEALRLASEGSSMWNPHGNKKEESQTVKPNGLVGTAEQVKARLEEYQKLYGVDEFLAVTLTGDYNSRLRSYELLAQALSRCEDADLNA
ncbi:MsnO8 family LLM class oxidoreductase [Paenibacillus sp. J2TS4]|uniref:MsnO8 family LLM class oxidoreductase n=1 Tax=Paenibacillus sp. J2TS4 TaxID=2807194 RepID=UPI001B290369|nr:MsnO8 family LLM class oxidoreductase [Paenibacillus sp. J2TS4]GIP31931.1 hypothetical protein J2TS4_11410 [Paenibacillus sp. J2TS4]